MKLSIRNKLLGCGLSIFWAGTIAFGYPGVMGAFWQERFQVGNADTGLVVTFMLLALACAMFFSGRIHKSLGMSRCLIIAGVLYFLAFIVLDFARNIYWVYLWGFLANLGCSFVYGPGLTTVQQAMPQKRGLVSGILNLIFGTAAAIMSPVINWGLKNLGYQIFNLLLMVLIVLTMIMASWLLKREEKKEEADKARQERLAMANSAGEKHVESEGYGVGQALRTRSFWLIWFIWATMGAAGISMVSLAKSYGAFVGLAGVTLLTAFNLANGISRIFVGLLSDRIGARTTALGAFVLGTGGYFLITHVSGIGPWCICAICVGIGFGTLFTITGPLASGLFGLKNFGMIFGLIFTAYGFVGGIAGPAAAGMLLEKSGGNYQLVFAYLGILSLIGTLLMVFVREKRR